MLVGKGGIEFVIVFLNILELVGLMGLVLGEFGFGDEVDVFVSGYGIDEVLMVEDVRLDGVVLFDDVVVIIFVFEIEVVIFVNGM